MEFSVTVFAQTVTILSIFSFILYKTGNLKITRKGDK